MAIREYIGARYVPKFYDDGRGGAEWTPDMQYEPLTIVLHNGNSYTSRQYVPVGIDIENTAYWLETGNFNAQVEQYRQEVLNFSDQIEPVVNALDGIMEPGEDNYFFTENALNYNDEEIKLMVGNDRTERLQYVHANTPMNIIMPDEVITLDIGNAAGVQGVCSDGSYMYYATVDSNGEGLEIIKADYDGNLVQRVNAQSSSHFNYLTYDSKRGYIVAQGVSGTPFYKINPATLAIEALTYNRISSGISSLTYCAELDCYIERPQNSETYFFHRADACYSQNTTGEWYRSDAAILTTIPVNHSFVTQGDFMYNGYFAQLNVQALFMNRPSTIDFYTQYGRFCASVALGIPFKEEIEGGFQIGNTNNAALVDYHGHMYKISIPMKVIYDGFTHSATDFSLFKGFPGTHGIYWTPVDQEEEGIIEVGTSVQPNYGNTPGTLNCTYIRKLDLWVQMTGNTLNPVKLECVAGDFRRFWYYRGTVATNENRFVSIYLSLRVAGDDNFTLTVYRFGCNEIVFEKNGTPTCRPYSEKMIIRGITVEM